MAQFKIKADIQGIVPGADGIFETSDLPWIKHLRQLPDDQVEEIADAPIDPADPDDD